MKPWIWAGIGFALGAISGVLGVFAWALSQMHM